MPLLIFAWRNRQFMQRCYEITPATSGALKTRHTCCSCDLDDGVLHVIKIKPVIFATFER
jgi:hypothetical protein